MKKFSLLACMLSFTLLLQAQGDRQGLWIAPQLHFGAATILNNDKKGGLPYGVSVGAGIDIGYMLNDHIGIYIGLGYDRYNYRTSINFSKPYLVSATGIQHMLGMPLYFRYISGRQGKPSFVVDAGLLQEFLLATRTTIDNYPQPQQIISKDKSFYRSYHLSPFVFAGFNLSKLKRPEMNFGFQLTYHITDIFQDTKKNKGNYVAGEFKISFPIRCLKPAAKMDNP